MGQHDKTSNDRRGTSLLPEWFADGSLTGILDSKVSDLSYEERLVIWRRRGGMTQTEAAEFFRCCRNTYGRLERGEITSTMPVPDAHPLFDNEQCWILRRRKGWSQEECAGYVGITRYWLNQIELGRENPANLVRFWNEG